MKDFIEITVYSAPNHAWGKVTCQQLIELGIDLKISGYSYRDGAAVYLEEDCDLPLFVQAAKAAGIEIDFHELSLFSDDAVKRMERYSPLEVKTCYVPRVDAKPSRREVEAYLPRNFFITNCSDEQIVIKGMDNHGWTLEDYVIPRLGSGLISAIREVAA